MLLQQELEIVMDPLSEEDVEDHLSFKKTTVTASSKEHLKMTWTQRANTGTTAWEKCVKTNAKGRHSLLSYKRDN